MSLLAELAPNRGWESADYAKVWVEDFEDEDSREIKKAGSLLRPS